MSVESEKWSIVRLTGDPLKLGTSDTSGGRSYMGAGYEAVMKSQ